MSQGDDFRTIRALHYFLEAFPKRSKTIQLVLLDPNEKTGESGPPSLFKIISVTQAKGVNLQNTDSFRLDSINEQIKDFAEDIATRWHPKDDDALGLDEVPIKTSSLLSLQLQNLGEKISNRALLEVVIAFHGFQITKYRHGVFKGPVGEQ